MAGLAASYIWWWGGGSRFKLCVVLYLGIGLVAHLRAREGPADIGLRLDTLGPAARDALLATVAIGVLLGAAGTLMGSIDVPPLASWPGSLGYGVVWGTLQQYGLLAVFYRRFGEILEGHRGPALCASGVFALLHVPNPFLTCATFLAGLLACWLYRRSPNLLVLGILHGVISFLITSTLPETLTMGMRVGPGYLRFLPEP